MKQLEPYEQRMVDEYTALKTRIDSLTSFLRNEDSRSDIGLDEFRILIEQYCAMLEYADALKKRQELHSINVEAIKEATPVAGPLHEATPVAGPLHEVTLA